MQTKTFTLGHTLARLVFGLSLALFTQTALALDPFEPLREEEVTLPRIKSFMDSAFIKAGIDKDGDLKIEDGGFKTFVKIDEDKKLITLLAAWGLKERAPELSKLRLANDLNNDLILVRFSVVKGDTLWCDYQFHYDGGITPFAIVNNVKQFAKVVKGAVTKHDPDNLIGSE